MAPGEPDSLAARPLAAERAATRARLVALVTAAAGLAAAASAAPAPSAASAPPRVAPARVQVTATDYDFALSRVKIPAGRAIVQLANVGEHAHDLRLRRIGGTEIYGVPATAPGEVRSLSLTLVPGRYDLWCSIDDHRRRGMEATLTVFPLPKKVR
jgi:plastocyanin